MRGARAALLAALIAPLLAAAAGAQPAKPLFGGQTAPAAGAPQVYGAHASGCIVGAAALPADGPGWQAMRPSRNRAWGHPAMLDMLARLAARARTDAGWHGILVGDIAQPRGGPMSFGHRSHQTGLDADVWFLPAPDRSLSRREREDAGSPRMVTADRRGVRARFTDGHVAVLRAAAEDPATSRIFVNAAIKAELCRRAPGRDWLRKIRPWWGHDSHFHIRIGCPADSPECVDQPPPPEGDGCDDTLAWWFTEEALNPAPSATPRREPRMQDLPAACALVVDDG